MQSVPMINPGSITAMNGLSSRPVYFVHLNGSAQPALVVKGEKGGQGVDGDVSIAWTSKLMKNVNNRLVNTKIMTQGEIAVFRQFAANQFGPNTPQGANVRPGAPAYVWVKMPYVAGLSDGDMYDSDQNLNLKSVKQLIQKLSDQQPWVDLGTVVAVDVFNGNNDRFNIKTGNWANHGNLMFLANGSTSVIGLDTWDPYSDKSNLNTGGAFPELQILVDATRRQKFAQACTKGVGTEIARQLKLNAQNGFALKVNGQNGPQLLRLALTDIETLFVSYAPDFEQGLVAGANRLKSYLQQKVRQYTPATPWQPAQPQGKWQPARPQVQPARPQGQWVPAQPRVNVPPARPAQAAPQKTLPAGIAARMQALGW